MTVLMPRSLTTMTTSRLDSTFSPIEMTATSTSLRPAARSARSSVASSSSTWGMTSLSRRTFSGSVSIPRTSWPSSTSVVAMAEPKRPRPITAKDRRVMAPPPSSDEHLALGVSERGLGPPAREGDGQRQRAEPPGEHQERDQQLPRGREVAHQAHGGTILADRQADGPERGCQLEQDWHEITALDDQQDASDEVDCQERDETDGEGLRHEVPRQTPAAAQASPYPSGPRLAGFERSSNKMVTVAVTPRAAVMATTKREWSDSRARRPAESSSERTR